jgi:hypothetical protein
MRRKPDRLPKQRLLRRPLLSPNPSKPAKPPEGRAADAEKARQTAEAAKLAQEGNASSLFLHEKIRWRPEEAYCQFPLHRWVPSTSASKHVPQASRAKFIVSFCQLTTVLCVLRLTESRTKITLPAYATNKLL